MRGKKCSAASSSVSAGRQLPEMLHHGVGIDFPDRAELLFELAFPFEFILAFELIFELLLAEQAADYVADGAEPALAL